MRRLWLIPILGFTLWASTVWAAPIVTPTFIDSGGVERRVSNAYPMPVADQNTDATALYQKLSSDGFWSTTKTDTSILLANHVYTDSILTQSSTAVRAITGISMGMWCSAFWTIKLNDVVKATGMCIDALNFAFPTPIPVPINTDVEITYNMVKDSAACTVIYTVYGDTR